MIEGHQHLWNMTAVWVIDADGTPVLSRDYYRAVCADCGTAELRVTATGRKMSGTWRRGPHECVSVQAEGRAKFDGYGRDKLVYANGRPVMMCLRCGRPMPEIVGCTPTSEDPCQVPLGHICPEHH